MIGTPDRVPPVAGATGWLRPAAVAVVAGGTTVAGHVVVTGTAPGPATVLLAVALAAVVVAAVPGRRRALGSALGAVLLGQLVCHAVFALTLQAGCLPAVGHAAGAGVDLAVWRVSPGCDPAQLQVVGSPEQLALLALLAAVPVLAGHTVLAVLGAVGIARLERAADAALALLGRVLVRLPGVVRLPVSRLLPPAVGSGRVLQTCLVPVRPLVRRGPPGGATA